MSDTDTVDILDIIEEGLPFVCETKGDHEEIRTVNNTYQLQHNERFITKEEFIQKRAFLLYEYLKKENHKFKEAEKVERYKLRLDNYIQNVKDFYKHRPFFYDKNGIFWFWDEINSRYLLTDDTELMDTIDKNLGLDGQTITAMVKSNYLEAFRRIGRRRIPENAPVRWIQFKGNAFSLRTKNIYKVTPNFFFTNPIPWEIGEDISTPVMDKLFVDWVGEEMAHTLYEVIAYCCYRDYPIQTLFCLFGSGRNGKSCFLRLLHKFLGGYNCTSTELDTLLDSRFESFKLYRKLCCVMGETNFQVLSKSSMLKKLTGGDMIGYEMKNKMPFDDRNYSKMLIASNSLPSSSDTSEGFYRRWMIIDFPNEFPEGKDILETIPDIEYSNLARKIITTLPNLLNRGNFTNQGDIAYRTRKYILASNPLSIFLGGCCELGDDKYVLQGKLYTAYVTCLNLFKRRRVSLKEFKTALENEGLYIEHTMKASGFDDDGRSIFKTGNWIVGLDLRIDWEERLKNVNFN